MIKISLAIQTRTNIIIHKQLHHFKILENYPHNPFVYLPKFQPLAIMTAIRLTVNLFIYLHFLFLFKNLWIKYTLDLVLLVGLIFI